MGRVEESLSGLFLSRLKGGQSGVASCREVHCCRGRDRRTVRTVRTETLASAGRREVCQWCDYAIVYAIHQRVLALHRSRGNLLPGGQVPVPKRRVLGPEPWSSTELRNSRQRYSYVDSNSGYRSTMFRSSAAVVYECETGSFVLRKENTICRGFWIFGV